MMPGKLQPKAISLWVKKIRSIVGGEIGLQCYLAIPRRVTFLYDNRIDFNENKDVFKYLNEFLPSDDWFPYEYINSEVKNKVDKNKGQLSGYEM